MNKSFIFITIWGGENRTQTSHIKSKRDFIEHVECNKNKYVEQCKFLFAVKETQKFKLGPI